MPAIIDSRIENNPLMKRATYINNQIAVSYLDNQLNLGKKSIGVP